MYHYSSGPSKWAFSTRPCQSTSHPSQAFKQHAISNPHQPLQNKLTTNGASVYDQIMYWKN